MMPKSFSLRDLRNASPFYSQGQPYLKPIPHFEDHLLSETEKRASEGTNTDSQGSLSPTLPLDKCKKRIKLRVNQNFPQDFFEVQGEDFNEEKKTYFLKPIPVKVIRSPANKCKRAMTSESSKPPLGDTSSFRSQNYQYVNTEERESPSPSRSKNILEGQDPVNKIFGIRSNAPPRSKSTEPGSAPELKGRRARSPLVPKRRFEDGQDYIVNQFPLIYPEHEVRSASGMKRTNYLTPRKDQMASFRRQRHVAFSSCDDERSPENKSVAPESSHMLVSDSYCWGGEGYNQTDEKKADNNDELLQALPDSATKLLKSYSRDSLKRQNESVPRPGHYHSASREQTLIPIGSSRKIARILRTEEADNSRMTTTERDIIAAQYFSIPENMSQERSQQPRQQANSRGPASFHKILLKSIGMNALDAIQQRQPFEKQGPRVIEKEQSKENESEWVKKMISQKIAEQKKYSSICAPCVLKEGLEFSFSKEYNKQENNDTVPTMPPVKEDREGVSSPEYPDPYEYRSVGSRSQARIKKKFVLIKRE